MTNKELSDIKNRLEKVTNGPWKSFIEGRDHESGSSFIMVGEAENRKKDIELIGGTNDDYDFIASARQDVPKLIAEIERLQKLLNNH